MSHRTANTQPHVSQYAATAHSLRVLYPSWGAPILRSILILSMDQGLLATRVLVLKSSGFTAVGVTRIDVALKLAKAVQPSVGIICHTLSASE